MGLLGSAAQPARALPKWDRAQQFAEFDSRSMQYVQRSWFYLVDTSLIQMQSTPKRKITEYASLYFTDLWKPLPQALSCCLIPHIKFKGLGLMFKDPLPFCFEQYHIPVSLTSHAPSFELILGENISFLLHQQNQLLYTGQLCEDRSFTKGTVRLGNAYYSRGHKRKERDTQSLSLWAWTGRRFYFTKPNVNRT